MVYFDGIEWKMIYIIWMQHLRIFEAKLDTTKLFIQNILHFKGDRNGYHGIECIFANYKIESKTTTKNNNYTSR